MPTLNFPSNPALNDEVTIGTKKWRWNGQAWDLYPTLYGPTGPTGPQGNFGGVTLDYTFSTDTTNSDPTAGKLKFNGAVLNNPGTTTLYISEKDDNNLNIDNYLQTIDDSTSPIKGHFRITNKVDPSDFAIFVITGSSTDNGTYYSVPCSYLSGSAVDFSNSEDILITFARTGDKGVQGDSGWSGISGFSGFSGISGYSGYSGNDGQISGAFYTFSTNTVEEDPGSGKIRYNNSSLNSISYVYISKNDLPGNALNSFISSWDDASSPFKGYLFVKKSTEVQILHVTGPITYESSLYFKVPVSNVSGAAIYTDNSTVQIEFYRAGDSGFSGISGYSGFSGTSGFSGLGESGFSGFSGESGFSGISGFSGESGFSGISGYSGESGFSGISGYSGDSGFSGYSGDSGFSGYSGDSGFSGESGFSGISGFSGEGGSGFSGYSGESGFSGLSGFSGMPGAFAASGFSGFSGYSGISGYSGGADVSNITEDVLPGTDNAYTIGKSGYQWKAVYVGTSGIYIDNKQLFANGTNLTWNGNVLSTVNLASVSSDIIPSSNVTYSLGSSGYQWKDLWVSGSTIYIGGNAISVVDGNVFVNGTSISGFSGYSGHSGYSGFGESGFSGFSGYSGYGESGFSGISGYSGKDGNFGGASFNYKFTKTITSSDPGPGYVRFETLDISASTFMLIDYQQADNSNIGSYLQTIDDSTSTIKGHFKLSEKFNPNNFALYTISSLTDETGYYKIICAYVSGSVTTFDEDAEIIITFARTGDKGEQGISGFSGYSGSLSLFTTVTSTHTATNKEQIIADTSSGGFTVNLPATPTVGFFVNIADGNNWSVNNLIVGRNGSTIEGVSEDLTVDVGGTVLQLVYDGTTWQVYSNFGPKGIDGVSGFSGFSGLGISGFSGFSGLGESGFSGVSGYSGESGFSGVSGYSGESGFSGVSGFSGISGYSGLGESGFSGYSGFSGISGFSGLTGPSNTINASDDTATTTLYPVMVGAAGSNQTAKVTTTKLYFDASTGDLSATNFNNLSDITLKENIQPLDNPMDIINKLQSFSFNWKDTGKRAYGFIAQEIEKILPELVHHAGNYKTVNYIQLIAFLIEAMKHQQKEIEDIKKLVKDNDANPQ